MFPQAHRKQILTLFPPTDKRRLHGLPRMHSVDKPFTPIRILETDMTRKTSLAILVLATTLSLPALAYDPRQQSARPCRRRRGQSGSSLIE
jgi:hypothetical protein